MEDNTGTGFLVDENEPNTQDHVSQPWNDNKKEDTVVEENQPPNAEGYESPHKLTNTEGYEGPQAVVGEQMEGDVPTNLEGMNTSSEDPETPDVKKTEELLLNVKNQKGKKTDGTELQSCEYVTTVNPAFSLPEDLNLETQNNGVNTETTVFMKEYLEPCPDLEKVMKEHCSQGKRESSKSVIVSSEDGSLLNINVGSVSSEIIEGETDHTDEDESSSSNFIDCDSLGNAFLNPAETTIICRPMDHNEGVGLCKDYKDDGTSLESEAFSSCEDSFLDLCCDIVNAGSVGSESHDPQASSEKNGTEKLEVDVPTCPPCLPSSPQNILFLQVVSEGMDTNVELESVDSEGYSDDNYENDKHIMECSLEKDTHLNPENNLAINESTPSVETEESINSFIEKNNDYISCDEMSEATSCHSVSPNEHPQLVEGTYLPSVENSEKRMCNLSHDYEKDSEPDNQEMLHTPAYFTLDQEDICEQPMGTFEHSHLDSGVFASSENSLLNIECDDVSDDNVEPENTDHEFVQKGDDHQFDAALLEQCVDEKHELPDSTLEEGKCMKSDNYIAHASTDNGSEYDGTKLCLPSNAVSNETVCELSPLSGETDLTTQNYGEIKSAVQEVQELCFDEKLSQGLASSEEGNQTLVLTEDSMLSCENIEVLCDDQVMHLESEVLDLIQSSCLIDSSVSGEAAECKSLDPVACAQLKDEQCNEDGPLFLEPDSNAEKKEELPGTGMAHEHSPSLNLHAVEIVSEIVEANMSQQHECFDSSDLSDSVTNENMDLVNVTGNIYGEVMENCPLVHTEMTAEEKECQPSFYVGNCLDATKGVELDEACEISELHDQNFICSEQQNASPLVQEPPSDSEGSNDASEFKNTDSDAMCEQTGSKQTSDMAPSSERCIYHENMEASLETTETEKTSCLESVLPVGTQVNFGEDIKVQMESDLHSYDQDKHFVGAEPSVDIFLVKNSEYEGSTFTPDSSRNCENDLTSVTLKLQKMNSGIGDSAEKCVVEHSLTTEPAACSGADNSKCLENAERDETTEVLKNPSELLQNDAIFVSGAGCEMETSVSEVREQENFDDCDSYCLKEVCEIAVEKTTVVSSSSVHDGDIAEVVGPQEVMDKTCISDEKQNIGLFSPASGHIISAEVPFLSVENTSVMQEKEENDSVKMEESTDCVDFARILALHCDYAVPFETAQPEVKAYEKLRQDQEHCESYEGLLQEQSSVSAAKSLCSDQYSLEPDETMLAKHNIDNANEVKLLVDFICDQVALNAQINSSMANSGDNSSNVEALDLTMEVSSSEQCHDIPMQELGSPPHDRSLISEAADEEQSHHMNCDKNGSKLSQWNELTPGKLNHIDWEWKFKILEEENNKLCEQNKYLQSELQLHLEKETSMSVELDQVRDKFTESERNFHLLENENLRLVSDCQDMKKQSEMLIQRVEVKDDEIAELHAQFISAAEQYSCEMREAEMKLQEFVTNATISKEEADTLKEQNLSMETELTSCKEMINSLNSSLCEVTGTQKTLLEENKRLNDAVDEVKSLNSQLLEDVGSLRSLVGEKDFIIEDLKALLATAEGAKTSQLDEIKELEMLLNVKENLLTEKVAGVTELQEAANSAKRDVNNICSLLKDLGKSVCAHSSAVSCETENQSDVNALYCDIEKLEESISQLIEVIPTVDISSEDNAATIFNFNTYITSVQRLWCLQQHILCCLQATHDVKDNELSDVRLQLDEKINELSISNEKLREANLALQQQNEKLQQVEEDLLSKTSQLHNGDIRLAELDNEMLLRTKAFQEDIQNLEKNKEELIVELEQKSNSIKILQQEMSDLKEILYQREQLIEQKGDILFSAEEKAVEIENLLEEKTKVLQTVEKNCQDYVNKIQEFQNELTEIKRAVLHFLDEIHIYPRVNSESLPADKSAEMPDDKSNDLIMDCEEDKAENNLSPLGDGDMEEKCTETKTADKELVPDVANLSELIGSDTCSTLNLIKYSFAAIRNKCSGLEEECERLASLEYNIKEIDSLKATMLNIEAICSHFVQEAGTCIEDTVRAAAENYITMKELCNDLKNKNSILESSLSDKEGTFRRMSNELETIENMIGSNSKERNVSTDASGLCLRLSHIVYSLQNINSTYLPEFLQPVLNEMEEAINKIVKCQNRTVPHLTIREKVELVSQILSELQENFDTASHALHEKEQQYAKLCSFVSDIEAEFSINSGNGTCTDIQPRAEKLLGEIQADKMLNQDRIEMLAKCEETMISLQTVVDNIMSMLKEKLKKVICETQLPEIIKYLLDKKTQLEDEVNKGKSHFESCNQLMEYFKNQINLLEETNLELKANVESYENTLHVMYQEKKDLQKSFSEKLATLSAEISTLTNANAEWKAKSETSEKLVHNYEEQVASMKKVKLQLNNTIEEIEEELQKTYTDREELKTQISNMTVEIENLRRAMSTDCEELESSESLVLLYNKTVTSLKIENQELIQRVSEKEKEILGEKENVSYLISELRVELKSFQDSVLEKDSEIENLKSKLKSKDNFLSELKADFEDSEAAKLQQNNIFEEVKEILREVDAERLALLQENENLVSEIEILKQDQLSKDKNTVSNTEILEEEMEKLNETCKFLRECLCKKDEEMDKVVLEREHLLKDLNKLMGEREILCLEAEEYHDTCKKNKHLSCQIKELERQVIEIEDENLSAYERLESLERLKNEVEKEWFHRFNTYNHKIETLDIKISKLNEIFKSDAERQKLHNSIQLSNDFSESSEKNVSDIENNWQAISNNFEMFHKRFLDFFKNAENVVEQRNAIEEKLSLTNTELEKYRCEIHDWRNTHQKIIRFISDFAAEICVLKSVLKSNNEEDLALSAREYETNVLKHLQAIKGHLSQINKENSQVKLKMEQLEKLMSELKGKNEDVSQECEAVKKKNLEIASELVCSQLQIERLTEDVKCLQKVNSELEEEVSTLQLKVSSFKQKEKDFLLKDEQTRSKVKILSSELADLLNEKKTLEYENNILVAKLNRKKENDGVSDLEQHITCLKQNLDECENEIRQLTAEKQQYKALHSMEISDMTVSMPMLGLFSEIKPMHHPCDDSKKKDLVSNKGAPNSCDDTFTTSEVKNTIAAILQILCIENTHLPLEKQLDLIKGKVTSVLENSTTSFQLAKQLCKEIAPSGGEFEGKSPSDLLHTLGSKFKDQQQLISDINRNICHHIQTVKCFLKIMCELVQILRPTDVFSFGNIFEHLERVVKGVDANHYYTALSSVDSALQNRILPLVHTMKDQAVRKTGPVVSEELIQERQKVIKLESKLEELTKAKVKLEGKLRLCLFNSKQMEKSYVSLQQENAMLQKNVGQKENVDTEAFSEVKELREKLCEMEKKYERNHDELCATMEKLVNSIQEVEDLRSDCEWLTLNLEHTRRELELSKASSKGPASNQMDTDTSSKDSSGEKAVAKAMSYIPRRILSSKDNVPESTPGAFKGKGDSLKGLPGVELLPRNPPEWD